ncbi:MAG: DUF2380 domain-containing protein [Candidatus Hatepunaea meridiana]|nr:DUF2380 domain-containing protein [Candidatus Hatepunaea meridiana]
MKRIKTALIAFFCCLTGLSWAAKQPHVVVFPLKAEGVSSQTANLVTERIRAKLGASGRVKVLERNEIDKILETIGKNLEDCTSEGCGIELGRQLDADKIVAGSITRIGKRITIAVNFLDVETTEREVPTSIDIDDISEDKLIDYIPDLVDQIIDRIPIEGKILEVAGKEILVDIGSETGIKLGNQLLVIQIKKVLDPETN